jgi:hypothetical protein
MHAEPAFSIVISVGSVRRAESESSQVMVAGRVLR